MNPAVGSTHVSFAATRWPMHAEWRCCKRNLLAQLARTFEEWHCNSFADLIDEMELWDWNVADNLKTSSHNWQSRCTVKKSHCRVSRMGRENGPKPRFSARPWKNEPNNNNVVHQELQNMNWQDWGFTCRRWADNVGRCRHKSGICCGQGERL